MTNLSILSFPNMKYHIAIGDTARYTLHMQKSIVVIGSFVEDLIVQTNKMPLKGETVFGNSFSHADGGKGANQAVQIGRLQGKVKMIGKVGSDSFGKSLVNTCLQSGVDVDQVIYAEGNSGISTVILEGDKDNGFQNRIIMTPGANNLLNVEELKFIEDEIDDYSIIVLQNEIPQEVNDYLADLAYRHHVVVIANPAPYRKMSDEFLSHVTYLTPNETEFSSMTGVDITGELNEKLILEAANKLLDKGVKNIIITLGSRGAMFINKEEHFIVKSVQNVKSIDPTAAGDSFIGAFATFTNYGLSPKEAIYLANAVGSLTVQRLGAMPSLCTLGELRQYLLNIKDKEYQGLDKILKDINIQEDDALGHYKETIRQEVDKTLDNLNEEFYQDAFNIILEAKANNNRVHVTGIGKPSHIAQYIASLLSSTGTPAYYLHGTEAVHGSSGQLVAGDVVIAISNSGNTQELLATVIAAKNNGCKIIGVTGNKESQIAKLSDAHLLAHIDIEGGPLGRAPRSSILAETIVLQGLSVLLQKEAKITPKQYVKWHPSGALGKLKDNEK